MKIIPSINTETFEIAKERINILKNLTKEFHIDISDLNFANFQTWSNPKELDRLDEDLKLQVHLMMKLKPQEILKWSNSRIKILILHLEACELPFALIKFAKRLKKEIIIAWSPSIEKEFIDEFVKFVNGILVLGVHPGKSGQEFLPSTFERLEIAVNYKKNLNKLKIFVDGGINKSNITEIIKFKPDYIILGKAIFDGNPLDNYLFYSNLIKNYF